MLVTRAKQLAIQGFQSYAPSLFSWARVHEIDMRHVVILTALSNGTQGTNSSQHDGLNNLIVASCHCFLIHIPRITCRLTHCRGFK